MKLLKYPKSLHNGKLSGSCIFDNKLVLIGRNLISVWDCKSLQDAARGKCGIKSVKNEFSIELLESDDMPRWILAMENQLVIAGDRTIWRSKCEQDWRLKREKTTFEVFLALENNLCVTDMKVDEEGRILFIGLSKENAVWMYDLASWERIAIISVNAKPVTLIVDPLGEIVILILLNRVVMVYQYDKNGAVQLYRQLNQNVRMNPVSYNVTMSPQGDLLPMANSMRNTTSSVQILDRQSDFCVESSLVGYADKCKILKFSPRLYEKRDKDGTNIRYNLLASSGNDAGSVVVWNTKRTRPLLNAAKLATTIINDLQWTNDGTGLFAISNDGYLFIFAFQEIELGDVLPFEEVYKRRAEIKRLNPLPAPAQSELKGNLKVAKDTIMETNSTSGSAMAAKTNKTKILPTIIQSTSMEFNGPSYSVPKDLKRKPKEDSKLNGIVIKKQKKELEPIDFLDTNLLMPNISFSKLRLATPKVRLSFQNFHLNNRNLVMEIKNGSGDEQIPTSISLFLKDIDKDTILFQDFTPKFITMCACGDSFWACSTEDGNIRVYSNSGRKLLPPLIMGVKISFLEACGQYLMCITSIGQLYCWNVDEAKLKFPMNTIYPLLNPELKYSDDVLTRAENITMCTVTSNGIPLVTLSNGDGHMFDADMETWMLINDSWWAYASQYWDFTNTSQSILNDSSTIDKSDKKNKYWNEDAEHLIAEVRHEKRSIVNYMESKTNDEMSRKGRIRNLQRFAKTILMKEGFENLEDVVTLSHLENRILVSLRLKEKIEFTRLLKVYCIRLAEMGFKNRLNDVLSWLYNDGNYKNETIADQPRETLIKETLAACADIRQVQRVTTSFAAALGIFDESL